jgi:ubiquinone/menaquinone biosynthesis C-methylase UbiE
MAKKQLKAIPVQELLKLDLGCGKNTKEGFYGVDSLKFDAVDLVHDLRKPWPWKDGSVEEVHCSHFIEHLTWPERVHFFNELYRVLRPEGKCTLIIPHWASSRYYCDPTHKEPFSEFAFYYLDKNWREGNAPHVGYKCDFLATWGYALHQSLMTRNQEYQQHAMQFFKEACQDIIATLTKR